MIIKKLKKNIPELIKIVFFGNTLVTYLKNIDHRNTPNIDLFVEEDDIVIFPSKTKHATISNITEDPRISISGDVIIMLKNIYLRNNFNGTHKVPITVVKQNK